MKILIVKTSALGDIVHTFPVVAYLTEKFPDSQIDWVVEKPFASLPQSHPHIHNTLTVETKKWRKNPFKHRSEIFSFRKQLRSTTYDLLIDLQGNTKSALITLQAKSPVKVGFAKQSVPEWPNLIATNFRSNPPPHQNIRDDYLSIVQAYFKDSTTFVDPGISLNITPQEESHIDALLSSLPSPHTLVCPGAAWRNKQMTEEGLASLLKQFHKDGTLLFIWGNSTEQSLAKSLAGHFPNDSAVIDRLSLPSLQNLMGRVELVIAMDSLPLHLAGTTTTPTFSVFGPSSADKYRPKGPQHRFIQGTCPYSITFDKRCPHLRTCQNAPCIRGKAMNPPAAGITNYPL